MAWSTRELADLAGTTVNTVRHYHRLGLLEQPDRLYNGYKQYDVRHLVSLLRTRRLADLGVPLSQMKAVSAGDDSTPEALRELDAELQSSIERLQKAREDIEAILREHAPADVPSGFEAVGSRLSVTDSSMLHISTQLYDTAALADFQKMAEHADDVSAAIDKLPGDADEETKAPVVERLAQTLAQYFIDYPWLSDPVSHLSKNKNVTAQTLVEAVFELYNPAQLDVLVRANALATERVQALRDSSESDVQTPVSPLT